MKSKNEVFSRISDGTRKFAALIDPDKYDLSGIKKVAVECRKANADFVFYGGSLITNISTGDFIRVIKELSGIPVVLFPGNNLQLNPSADAILLLSLISGRNPELLIGKHVTAAPFLRQSNLEILPTGYMLIDGGRPTAVSYMSNTVPIPSAKSEIAVSTAMAGEMLGLKLIYMDAGSGADNHIPAAMIQQVRQNISVPLIIGGGIRTMTDAKTIARSGADVVVVGNALEKNPELIRKFSDAIH